MEANLTNIDGKSKFKDVSIAPMQLNEHLSFRSVFLPCLFVFEILSNLANFDGLDL